MAAPSGPDILTLPLLRQDSAAALVSLLADRRDTAPVALVLPCHVRELGTPALEQIVRELSTCGRWITRIVVGLDGADEAGFRRAGDIFRGLPLPLQILWNDSPQSAAAFQSIAQTHPAALQPGKGRNVWACLHWLSGAGHNGIVAVHDCDIAGYSADMLARLIAPVGEGGITFCKGYCARYGDRLHGRVERLLMQPLLAAARSSGLPAPAAALVQNLSRWRYVLAGEMAFDFRTGAECLRFPPGWGLETALAMQVAAAWPGHIAQVELAPNYEHRHHDLCPAEPSQGLHRMAIEVAAAFFDGIGWQHHAAVVAAWAQAARAALEQSRLVSLTNGLNWPESAEQEAVALFGRIVAGAAPGTGSLLPPLAALSSGPGGPG